jgi:hypothetical protein
VRVFAVPGQKGPVLRALSFRIRAPVDVASRPVSVSSNVDRWDDTASGGPTLLREIGVCVPASGHADVTIETPEFSQVYGDMRSSSTIGEYREGGVLLAQIALADEIGPPCEPSD